MHITQNQLSKETPTCLNNGKVFLNISSPLLCMLDGSMLDSGHMSGDGAQRLVQRHV